MTAAVRTTAVGVFFDHDQANAAVEELHRSGFGSDQVGVAVPKVKPDEAAAAGSPGGTHTEEGAAAGVVTGGALGAVAGAVASSLIPAVGPALAIGILAGAFGGAAAGATAGGLLGALIGHGIPEDEARHYEREFAAGRTIVTIKAGDRYDEAVKVLRRHGAYGKGSPLF